MRIGNQPFCCLSKWALRDISSLKSLSLAKCDIHKVPNIQTVAHTLNSLLMERNNLSYLPKNMFLGCKVLKSLALSFNKFKSIPNITEVSATLRYLYMTNNRVADVSALYDVPFPLLSELHLFKNEIAYFPYHSSGWACLSQLDLRYNLIKSISSDFFRSSGFLLISADHNPWHCDQNLCWIKHCNRTLMYQRYMCGNKGRWRGQLFCASPSKWKGRNAMHAGNQHV